MLLKIKEKIFSIKLLLSFNDEIILGKSFNSRAYFKILKIQFLMSFSLFLVKKFSSSNFLISLKNSGK